MTAARLTPARTLLLGTASLAVLMLAVITSTELVERDAPRAVTAGQAPAPTAPADAPALAELRDDAAAPDARLERQAEAPAAARLASPPAAVPAPQPPVANRAAAGASTAATADMATGAAESLAAPAPATSPAFRAPGIAPYEADAMPAWREDGRDRFADADANGVKVTAEEPVSTFSIDTDTASYSFVRRALMQGTLPPAEAVRIEELVNYFPYDYAPPVDPETPFAAHVDVMPTPWNEATRLMRIGIEGYALPAGERPRANLVFLVDTSGSMHGPDRLPLVVNSLRLLLDTLDADDTVAIVAYAGSAGTVLEPTRVADEATIVGALDRLMAGGSTAGGEGIAEAYRLAEASFDPEGVNRVILATDGDFNVGVTSTEALTELIERKRDSGIFLSVLGFGRGNLNDQLMQALAQNGNGQAAYIDTLAEARKTLVEEASSTLFPIAKDVKIQVEFNPATVAEYRLIGYETRLLDREDFNNDRVDAGEIGAGHSVTALYEITPAGSARAVDPLRYGEAEEQRPAAAEDSDEYAFVKIRYKLPEGAASRLITRPVTPADEGPGDTDARFAAAVAAFGQLLKGGEHLGAFGFDDAAALANGAKGEDPFGYRAEFVTLTRLAGSLAPRR